MYDQNQCNFDSDFSIKMLKYLVEDSKYNLFLIYKLLK
jgi:hypothetical protein